MQMSCFVDAFLDFKPLTIPGLQWIIREQIPGTIG